MQFVVGKRNPNFLLLSISVGGGGRSGRGTGGGREKGGKREFKDGGMRE